MKFTVDYILSSLLGSSCVYSGGHYDETATPKVVVYHLAGMVYKSDLFVAKNGNWLATFSGTADCNGCIEMEMTKNEK